MPDYESNESKYRSFPRLVFKYIDGGLLGGLTREFDDLMETDYHNGDTLELEWDDFPDWVKRKFDDEVLAVYDLWLDDMSKDKLTLIFESDEQKTMFVLKYL